MAVHLSSGGGRVYSGPDGMARRRGDRRGGGARVPGVFPGSRAGGTHAAGRGAGAGRWQGDGRRGGRGSLGGPGGAPLDFPLAPRRSCEPRPRGRHRAGRGIRAGALSRRLQARGIGAERALHGGAGVGPGATLGAPDLGGARPAHRVPGAAGRQARGRATLRADPVRLADGPAGADGDGVARQGGRSGQRRGNRHGGAEAIMRRRHIPSEGARGARGRRWQELREQRRRGIFLLPSLLTTGNLFCGFLALILTTQGRYTEAAVAVFVAMVLDLLDGKVARLTKTTSQFGVEFDSLADVVSFCVAPAFMLYTLALAPLGRAAWLGAFLFVICGALRLARFNVYTGIVDRRYFVGLPTPAAAGMVVAVVLLLEGEPLERWQASAIAVGTYIVALLMVSTFRYWSFK